jgi:hypothetical protein
LAKAEILAGICGFNTTVRTRQEGAKCKVNIESECQAIQRLAAELTEVEPFREISFRGKGPLTLELAARYCPHAACPVPVGIIKAIEIESGLALPADPTIQLSKSDE